MTVDRPPEHVLTAFGLTGLRPVPLGSSWEGGWRCGEVVLSMVADNARASWSAKVRETLFVDGVRLARLLVQQKAMSDLVEVEVPRTVQLHAPVVTADNVEQYLPTAFES